MAEKGITIFDGETTKNSVTKAQNIIDVTGAGDIVCCILAYYMSLNLPIQDIINLATNVATKSVQHMGTYTLGKKDILEVETGKSKLILFEDLLCIKELYKEKKIAFTNGCFDILHDGHINLFKFCKEKGDILIVGLNSDKSISKLKGETRPINKIKTRLEILKSIMYIDYIIVFEEETPIEMIKKLEPYYLIKGGDYIKENVVGNEFVKETLIFNTVEGISTTKIIEKIKKYT
jgi:D-beta-D-heptose 7-phosphate kinase/D-beta-D-heptose 1-phosphate adenosyltransferase